jgi:hypothetical protein
MSQANPGAEVPFTFTPSTTDGTTASGTLILDPMDFGSDTYGAEMTSDVEWALVGPPVYAYGETPAAVNRFAASVRNGRGTDFVDVPSATSATADESGTAYATSAAD